MKVRLKDEVGDAAYRSWLRPITLHGMSDGAVKLSLPTRFMRDWVNTHYAERIRTLWGAENPAIRNVEIVVEAARAVSVAQAAAKAAAAAPRPV
ncbi:chromosomal replication initiation protein, partial [Paramagnetospirillum caucaseum]